MDEEVKARCRAWCEGKFWQLQTRGAWRYAYKGEVMVRYYEEANLDPLFLQPLVEWLNTSDSLEAGRFTIANKPFDASGWKVKNAWYETGDGDTKEATKLKVTRLYQALYKDAEGVGADGPYSIENGCQYKVTHTFHWNEPALGAVPASSSGVAYTIGGVSRDDETGCFSWYVERKERVRQDIAEYDASKTMFEHRSDEQHLGVKQSSVASAGKPASVGGGVMVQRKVTKNADCTSDVANETIEEIKAEGSVEETRTGVRGTTTEVVNRNMPAKAVVVNPGPGTRVKNELTPGGRWTQTITRWAMGAVDWLRKSCRKTIFEEVDETTTATATDPGFTHVVSASGGVIRETSVERNSEGGFDVREQTRKEIGVVESTVTVERSIEGTTVTTVNRNQASAAETSGIAVGETVRNEKTEGGLWNTTVSKVDLTPTGVKSSSCTQGALEHRDEETENVSARPDSGCLQDKRGKIVERIVNMTPRGSWDVTTRTRIAKQASADSGEANATKTTTRTAVRNAASAPGFSASANVEDSVSASVNEFGLVDYTRARTVWSEASASVSHATPLVTTNETTKINSLAVENGSASQGKSVSVTVTPNEHGSYSIHKIERTAVAAQTSSSWTEVQGDDTYTNQLNVYRNQTSVPPVSGEHYSVSVSVSINEFGLYDVIIHTKDKRSGGSGGGDAGSTYSGTRGVVKYYRASDGTMRRQKWSVPFSAYVNTSKSLTTGWLDGANDYPSLGLISSDSGGKRGIKFGTATYQGDFSA